MSVSLISADKRQKTKLAGLELGRAIAALAVVAHHAGQASDAFTSQKHGRWTEAGALGVDFFFVLSGFIIYHVHYRDARTWGSAIRFLRKRLTRIFVPYVPIVTLPIAAYALFPSISQSNRDWSLFTSFTLIPTGSPSALSVAWTLSYEMIFYCFFLIFFCTERFWFCVCAWSAAVVVFAATGTHAQPPAIGAIMDPLILEFVAGMVMAFLYSRLHSKMWFVPAIVGIALIISYTIWSDGHSAYFGLALAPLVLGIALAETRFEYRLPKSAIVLGAASYAVYLVHNPIQSIIARGLRDHDIWLLTFSACCLSGVAAGLAYHIVIEKPLLRMFTRFSVRSLETTLGERA